MSGLSKERKSDFGSDWGDVAEARLEAYPD